MKTVFNCMVLGLLLVAAVGCDEGPVGPPGPPGNANVFSLNFDFSPAEATLNGAVASEGYDVGAITPAVVDDGAVLVYFRDQGTWTALPFTIGVESGELNAVDYLFSFGYAYDDGFLEVFLEASSEDPIVWDDIFALLEPAYEMKAVIIEGFPLGKTAPFDVKDYESVKAYYGLED